MNLKTLLLTALGLSITATAHADINVGVILSATGPAASLGMTEKNTITLLPKQIGNEKVNYIVLDDGSDTTTAVKNIRKLVSEDKVDLIVGSSISPASIAMIDVAAESKTPMISMAAAARIVAPVDEKRHWVFKTPQNDAQMASAIVEHMAANNIKTAAFIGFADAYGEGWYEQFKAAAEKHQIKLVANERFNRVDTSVTGQALKIVAAKPDAVMIAGSGTPAALPQKTLKERGYKGKVYQTHGVANSEFLRICGKDCEGTLLPVGPVLMVAHLPDSNPVKKSAQEYATRYEAAYGKGTVSAFGGYAWDAGVLLSAAAPVALEKSRPGTPEFRAALRDAIEALKEIPGATGIFTMSATDHLGLDERARIMIEIKNGTWALVP